MYHRINLVQYSLSEATKLYEDDIRLPVNGHTDRCTS